ncbi:hypothetical protein B4073_2448 [Bacillus subtilis]|uniref:Uncharacterized protein n=1 Tax=Bacillus subtilis TaxID=1423 RepID=A0AAP1E6K6_BACIU|nr:hypothetical protein B4068_2468 [Bacillus subtilis]KIN46895.1 hypothetical protein B4073_2448 [Bacillus subtilis]KIN52291.1 hypothetical protein B4146_2632 [Bacillus subtilis]KZD88822.1 hypothetical protein B4122_4247 [Bacillus subtilis]KZD91726.1 hypothetical protein B4122_2368 [Bacillus subtilis]
MLKNQFFLARKKLSTECAPFIIIFPIIKKQTWSPCLLEVHFHYAVFAF